MTRLESRFIRHRELIIVHAEVVGPKDWLRARLVLDTGAAATTLVPELIEQIGYSERDSHKKAKVHTAVGEERGFWIRVAEFGVFGVTAVDFDVAVFPLGHPSIDGLVGMNFLRHFNFEVRPAEHLIVTELISKAEDSRR